MCLCPDHLSTLLAGVNPTIVLGAIVLGIISLVALGALRRAVRGY